MPANNSPGRPCAQSDAQRDSQNDGDRHTSRTDGDTRRRQFGDAGRNAGAHPDAMAHGHTRALYAAQQARPGRPTVLVASDHASH